MNYKIVFDRFLKDNKIYNYFYECFNNEDGIGYRRNNFNLTVYKNNYFCEDNAIYYISRAFRWSHHDNINWCAYHEKWQIIVNTKNKKYFIISLNEKIKIL